MSNSWSKNLQNSISAGAPPQTPFEELTALCLTPWLHLSDPISKGRGREEEGRLNEEENEGRKNYFGPPNLYHRSTDATVFKLRVNYRSHYYQTPSVPGAFASAFVL